MKPTILDEAISVVNGPRAADYGDFKDNWERVARIATALIEKPLTARECILVLHAVKYARLHHTPGHRDSHVDLAGYTQGLALVCGVDPQ